MVTLGAPHALRRAATTAPRPARSDGSSGPKAHLRPALTLRLLVLNLALLWGPLGPSADAADAAAVATEVVRAHENQDREALAKLARTGRGSPWAVVDEVLALGKPAAARAFADLVTQPDADALRRVAGVPATTDEEARRRFREARRLVNAESNAAALEALQDVAAPPGSILAARVGVLRAFALLRVRGAAAALAAFEATAAEARTIGWLRTEEAALRGGSRCATDTEDYTARLRILRRLEQVQSLRARAAQLARTQVELARVHDQLGDPRAAIGELARAWEGYAALEQPAYQAQVAANSSVMYAKLGEYAPAAIWLDRADRILLGMNDPGATAYARVIRGAIERELGNHDAAAVALESAVEMFGKDTSTDAADANGSLGLTYYHLDRHDDALRALERARAMYEKTKARRALGSVRRVIGKILLAQGKEKEGLAALEAVHDASEGDPAERCRVRLDLGKAHATLGRPEIAQPLLRRAAAEFLDLGIRDLEADACHALAKIDLAVPEPAAAFAWSKRAILALDHVVGGLSDEPMARARARRRSYFTTAATAAVRLQRPDLLAFTLEHWRARALLDAFGGRARLRGIGLPPALAEEERAASERLAAAHRSYREKVRQGGNRPERRAAYLSIRDAEALLVKVKDKVQRLAKDRADVTYPRPVSLPEIQAHLRSDQALVAYAILDDEVHALVVRKKVATIRKVGPAEALLPLCHAAEEVNFHEGSEAEGPLKAARTALVAPLGLDKKVRRVLVSPDGFLSLLPWPSLLPAYEVTCVPSATAFVRLEEPKRTRGTRVLALGDPAYGSDAADAGRNVYFTKRSLDALPGTRREIEALVRPGDVKLLGKQATESAFRKALVGEKRWRAIHFACHGILHRTSAGLCALALTPEGGNDGLLTTLDVFELETSTDLAVLSACESGRGELVSGEGVLGVARAFMASGASRVLASLWKVDDEATRHLMTAFYVRWRAGAGASAALRGAQQAVRARKKWRHPRYWAAWVLWGLPG